MEYPIGMHTVVETPQYIKASESFFSEAERTNIVNMVATGPECGDVMEGTGGFRKVRVGRGGMGSVAGTCDLHSFAMRNFPSSSLAFLLKTKRAI
jgi:hypothetical protein